MWHATHLGGDCGGNNQVVLGTTFCCLIQLVAKYVCAELIGHILVYVHQHVCQRAYDRASAHVLFKCREVAERPKACCM